ncbi:NAD(P)H-binding protein [Streptomyces sp. NPDC056983]|uniref:NAD(P)H-binding protein n=1 Tax=Streptomyces sp. NPDC056983 TaxID=3345987 RepID=UPI00363CBC85
MSQQNITDVLVVGATGSIGQLAVRSTQRHGLRPRALVRDLQRAEHLLPGVELVQADLEDTASLRRAVDGADALLLTHGSGGAPALIPVPTSTTAGYSTSCGPWTAPATRRAHDLHLRHTQ